MSSVQLFASLPRDIPMNATLFLTALQRIQHGLLQVVTPDGERLLFGGEHPVGRYHEETCNEAKQPGHDLTMPAQAHSSTWQNTDHTANQDKLHSKTPHHHLNTTLHINDWRACSRILRSGDIGFAEALEAGWVNATDLTALLRLAIRNERIMNRLVSGSRLIGWWYRLRHLLRANTREGSRRNIHAHYDIGNDFYRLWLDPGMTYSSALFDGDFTLSLENAQTRKYQRIIDSLDLRAGDVILEIGCGWGGFAEHAARQGIYVTGVTISPAQLQVAKQRIAAQGLEKYVQLLQCDYRDLTGEFDAIVSIEMIEAVGEKFWSVYFKQVAGRLKPNGYALIQTITIAEHFFENYRNRADFIQHYIFPGGMLPSPERFCQEALRAGLVTESQHAFGLDYAETLRRWRHEWENQHEAILTQGFDQRFMRIWRMYFAYCEAGFEEGKTDVVQFLLHKPAQTLPPK